MIHIDNRSRVPIYEQIQQSIESLIMAEYYKKDEQLPSVRALATSLALNPNTIQKAYAQMEVLGLIYSLPGRGSFVAVDLESLRQMRSPACYLKLENALNDLWQLRIPEEEIISSVHQSFIKYQLIEKGGAHND